MNQAVKSKRPAAERVTVERIPTLWEAVERLSDAVEKADEISRKTLEMHLKIQAALVQYIAQNPKLTS